VPALGDDAVILDGHEAGDIRARLDGEDEETARRSGWWPERSTEATVRAAFEDWATQWRSGGPTRAFAVRDRATRTLVGGCELRCGRSPPARCPTGPALGTAGTAMPPARRACSVATRSRSGSPGWRRGPDNYASRAVAERAGFTGHGTFTGDGGQVLVRYTRTAAPA
jgi:hypothetical protein